MCATRYIGLFAFLLLTNVGRLSYAYEIRVRLHQAENNTLLYLGYYEGDYQKTLDTALFHASERAYVFHKDLQLHPGVYFIRASSGESFDFLWNDEISFSIDADLHTSPAKLFFTGSPANEQYIHLLHTLAPLLQKVQTEQALPSPDTSVITAAWHQIEKVRGKFQEQYPQHLMSSIFQAQKDVAVPASPFLPDSPEDERWRFDYHRSHYFDDIPWRDTRLLYSPVLPQKINFFLDYLVFPNNDSIQTAVCQLLDRQEIPTLTRRFLVDYLCRYFEQSRSAGHEAIWAFLAHRYYLENNVANASPASLENIRYRLSRTLPFLVGATPPEVWYPDTNNQPRNPDQRFSILGTPSDYTLILFWEPDCPYCKKELLQLQSLYAKKDALGLQIISVSVHPDLTALKKITAELPIPWTNLYGGKGPVAHKKTDAWPIRAIPLSFLLDKDKKIIAKQISSHQIESFISHHKMNQL